MALGLLMLSRSRGRRRGAHPAISALRTALLLLAVLPPAARADEATGDVTDVRVVRSVEQHPGAALLWEPDIALWKPKHLVVAFGAGIPGKTDMGDLYASVSTNDGDSWSEPVAIFDHTQWHGAMQFCYANPVLYKPPGQDVLWCFGMRCPINYEHSEDSRLVGAISADGGRSWSPLELAMQYTGPLITVTGGITRVLDHGVPRYLMPVHRNTKRNDPLGSRDQLLLSSTSLLEWRLDAFIPQPVAGKVFLQEGAIAAGEHDGELQLVMRAARYDNEGVALDPPRAYSSASTDGGHTWSAAQAESDLWNSVAKAYFGRATDGTHLYVYSDGPAWSRMALRYKTKPPGGIWGPERTFFDAGTHNSYPALIEVAAGEYRAVWDSGTKDRNRTHIRFGKFHLP